VLNRAIPERGICVTELCEFTTAVLLS